MTEGDKTVFYPVRDLAKAKTLYGELLGVKPYIDVERYVGFNVGGQNVGLRPEGHSQGMTGPEVYWHVNDIEKDFRALLDAGAVTRQGVKDVGKGTLAASVKDADGNVIGLLQPPWLSERRFCSSSGRDGPLTLPVMSDTPKSSGLRT